MSGSVSPYRLEQAMSLLMQRIDALRADVGAPHDDDELIELLTNDSCCGDAVKVVHSVVRATITTEARFKEANERIAKLTARRDRYVARLESLRGTVLSVMQALGTKRLESAEYTVTLRQTGPFVVVSDATALPERYVRTITSTTPDKRKLLEDLRDGVVIEGASLNNGGETIVIRTS